MIDYRRFSNPMDPTAQAFWQKESARVSREKEEREQHEKRHGYGLYRYTLDLDDEKSWSREKREALGREMEQDWLRSERERQWTGKLDAVTDAMRALERAGFTNVKKTKMRWFVRVSGDMRGTERQVSDRGYDATRHLLHRMNDAGQDGLPDAERIGA